MIGPEEVVIGKITDFDSKSQIYRFEAIHDEVMEIPASVFEGLRLMIGLGEVRWFEIHLRRNTSGEVVKWEKAIAKPIKPPTDEELKELFGSR